MPASIARSRIAKEVAFIALHSEGHGAEGQHGHPNAGSSEGSLLQLRKRPPGRKGSVVEAALRGPATGRGCRASAHRPFGVDRWERSAPNAV